MPPVALMPQRPAVDSSAFISKSAADALKEMEESFIVGTQKLQQISQQMARDMLESLDHDGKSLPMVPSYVTSLPTGKEKGSYLTLDLGGTNLRICEVELLGDGDVRVHEKKCVVEDRYKTGSVDSLFDFIAEFVGTYVQERGQKQRMALGFTFSFELKQIGLDKGECTSWSKGFDLAGAAGRDVVGIFRDALKRKNVDVDVVAILNDTVATLLASAYQYHDRTALAFIFGTGTNAAYPEKQVNVRKWKGPKTDDGIVLINTEWGAFDNEHRVLPFTKYDDEIDAESRNPGMQRFEKLISGMYQGEIVRRVLVDLARRGVFANGNLPPEFCKMWAFDTSLMAAFEIDTSAQLNDVQRVFEGEFKMQTSLEDRQLVHRLTQLVSLRAARLSAAAIAAVLSCESSGEDSQSPRTLAGDGSVYNLYPGFVDRMKQALMEVMGPNVLERYEFKTIKDGSGIGAAALAAVIDHGS